MDADLGPGQMIDLKPPNANGVDLLYSHEYVAADFAVGGLHRSRQPNERKPDLPPIHTTRPP